MATKKAPARNTKEVWIPVTETMSIRAEVNEFKGVHRVDIREYVNTERYEGFTKKGINVPTEYLKPLYYALGNILKTVEAEGLFNEEGEEEEE